ncbi:EscU/YscU/HrcU family type III secretion system export apparatus switch protein [Paenibacillus sp. F411]|uniref:Putative FlhB domain protein n=1 Tax=Paenibacillus algicola TaxID=2565926 RepID=A0A4P8XKJ9_9BACL|nr:MULTISPECIES: EscU/YscU/HrcU family type III secretion system export apparatus switch protein [Paenibacillus]MBO2942762.1 EscU/YscU/HrcU family type III secretion system export apparatus switch protein [Paenibacillus sp. F411]QCT03242.1 putative FlhB domain protein [Paenibacillus algicola]
MKDLSSEAPASLKKAVALKYSPGDSEAPVVTAKGQGKLADTILERAREHGVPVQEDAALVEVLSKLDLDQQIPPELYQLVAEVLTYVYRAETKAREGRIHES